MNDISGLSCSQGRERYPPDNLLSSGQVSLNKYYAIHWMVIRVLDSVIRLFEQVGGAV